MCRVVSVVGFTVSAGFFAASLSLLAGAFGCGWIRVSNVHTEERTERDRREPARRTASAIKMGRKKAARHIARGLCWIEHAPTNPKKKKGSHSDRTATTAATSNAHEKTSQAESATTKASFLKRETVGRTGHPARISLCRRRSQHRPRSHRLHANDATTCWGLCMSISVGVQP